MADEDNEAYVDTQLTLHLERKPFRRFYILSNGVRYDVTERHQVAFNVGQVVLIHPKLGVKWFKKSEIAAIH